MISSPTLAIALSVGALVWQAIQFFLTRSSDARNRQFDAYHRLIKELVQPSEKGEPTYIDRQCAVVFELTHFRRYREVTFRILSGLQADWQAGGNLHPRLAHELTLALQEIGPPTQ